MVIFSALASKALGRVDRDHHVAASSAPDRSRHTHVHASPLLSVITVSILPFSSNTLPTTHTHIVFRAGRDCNNCLL